MITLVTFAKPVTIAGHGRDGWSAAGAINGTSARAEDGIVVAHEDKGRGLVFLAGPLKTFVPWQNIVQVTERLEPKK